MEARAVYRVDHTLFTELGDEERVVGVFRDAAGAEAAVTALSGLPGFSRAPAGFVIADYLLDAAAGWAEGFVWHDADFDEWPDLDPVVHRAFLDPDADVFLLEHHYAKGMHTQAFGLGLYSSLELAAAAVERFSKQPGFRALPDGFLVVDMRLDVNYWASGFAPNTHESSSLFRLTPST